MSVEQLSASPPIPPPIDVPLLISTSPLVSLSIPMHILASLSNSHQPTASISNSHRPTASIPIPILPSLANSNQPPSPPDDPNQPPTPPDDPDQPPSPPDDPNQPPLPPDDESEANNRLTRSCEKYVNFYIPKIKRMIQYEQDRIRDLRKNNIHVNFYNIHEGYSFEEKLILAYFKSPFPIDSKEIALDRYLILAAEGGNEIEYYRGYIAQISDDYTITIAIKILERYEKILYNYERVCDVILEFNGIAFNRMIEGLNKLAEGKMNQNIARVLLNRNPDLKEINIPSIKLPNTEGLIILNELQELAIRKALMRPFTLIQGPPGTGKTIVSTIIVYNFMKNKTNDEKILVCAPSNEAVDRIALLIHAYKLNVVRLCSKARERIKNKTESFTLHYKIRMDPKHGKEITKLESRIREQYRIKEKNLKRLAFLKHSLKNSARSIHGSKHDEEIIKLESRIRVQYCIYEKDLKRLGFLKHSLENSAPSNSDSELENHIRKQYFMYEQDLKSLGLLKHSFKYLALSNRDSKHDEEINKLESLIRERCLRIEEDIKTLGFLKHSLEISAPSNRDSNKHDEEIAQLEILIRERCLILEEDIKRLGFLENSTRSNNTSKHYEEIAKLESLIRERCLITEEDIKRLGSLKHSAKDRILRNTDIVCCTCSASADYRLKGFNFKYVLIEEASQSIEPECILPLLNGAEKVVIVGDHKQLGPVVPCSEMASAGLDVSMFERLVAQGNFLVTLIEQYRMCPAISQLPNQVFYKGLLKNGNLQNPLIVPPFENGPIMFCSVDGFESRSFTGSVCNNQEAEAVRFLVSILISNKVNPEVIAVILLTTTKE